MVNIPDTLPWTDTELYYYLSGVSSNPYMPSSTVVAGQSQRHMYQEDKIVSPTSMFRGSTEIDPHPHYHAQTVTEPGSSLAMAWPILGFMGDLGYPQGGHSSTDARETPRDALTAAPTSMRGYPSATLPTFDGVAVYHPLPVTTGVMDKALTSASTLIGGVAEVPYPLTAPPMTLPPSAGKPLIGVGYMVNDGRATHTQTMAEPDSSLAMDWQFLGFMGDLGYPQGGHSSADARPPPHNALAAASTSTRDYPYATPTSDGVARNHPLPVTTGVIDKASSRASTLIGGVAEALYPFVEPPMTPPSVGEPPIGVGYMVNSGRAIVATEDETPAIAGGHAQVGSGSGQAARPSQRQVQGVPVTRSVEVLKMEQRLLAQGVERTIVDRCLEIFKQGVTIDALEAQMTPEESEEYGAVGKKFRQLLEMARAEGTRTTHQCRLCRSEVYKNHRDALRHLLKSHFRIGYSCEW